MATKTKQVQKQATAGVTHNVGKVVQVIGPVLDVVLHQCRQPLVHEAPEMPFLGVAEEQRVDPELRGRGRRAMATQPQQHVERAAGAVMAGC